MLKKHLKNWIVDTLYHNEEMTANLKLFHCLFLSTSLNFFLCCHWKCEWSYMWLFVWMSIIVQHKLSSIFEWHMKFFFCFLLCAYEHYCSAVDMLSCAVFASFWLGLLCMFGNEWKIAFILNMFGCCCISFVVFFHTLSFLTNSKNHHHH